MFNFIQREVQMLRMLEEEVEAEWMKTLKMKKGKKKPEKD